MGSIKLPITFMNKEQIKKRIEELKSNISKHNYKYYILAEPVITDEQYDKLYRELLSLEMQYPEFLSSDSPTQKVGGEPLKGFKSIKHPIPMLSLDNTYNFNELRNFDKRVKTLLSVDIDIEYSVEPKIDGVAVRIVYEGGMFVLAASRGNGTIGDNITENIKTLKRLPFRLIDVGGDLKNIDIRGEVFLRKDTFLELNRKKEETGDKLFANTRNAAAGSLKLLNPKEVAKRNLNIFIHSFSGQLFRKFITYSQTLKKLGKLGLPIIEHCRVITGIDNVIEYINEWDKIRDNQNYITDGMVIKVNKLEYWKILGSTAKSPRWAIAYKFKAKQEETILKDVIFQVGRTGVITPVSILEPVYLAGSVISRTTLHNEDEIKRLGIKIGDRVIVEKGGDVIPKIVEYDSDSRDGSEIDIKFPSRCPVCGSYLVRYTDEVAVRCDNISCQAQLKRRIEHFAERDAMDIRGLGEELISKLVDKGLIKDFSSIYELNENIVASLDRMGDKSARNLIYYIEKSKQRDFFRVIYALGIRYVGINLAKVLARTFRDIDEIKSMSYEDLLNIEGSGEKVAKSIYNYFHKEQNNIIIKKLKDLGIKMKRENETIGPQPLKSFTFVITGTLKKYSRSEIKNKIENLGGKTADTISKNTNFLISGENPGSKFNKALNLNIKIINEKEFEKLII